VILDTTAVTAWAENNPYAVALIIEARRRVLPVIVLGEYEFGIRSSQKRDHYERWIQETLLPLCELHPVTIETSRIYSPIYHHLETTGQRIQQNDVWIAASAIQLSLPVLSRDTDFDRINGLKRIPFAPKPKKA